MTDNEIIKALECCSTYGKSCKDCPAFVKVDHSKCREVLTGAKNLINRKQAENDRLANLLEEWRGDDNPYKVEVERLRKTHPLEGGSYARICVDDLIIYAESIERWLAFCAEIQAEARAEFADRLKDEQETIDLGCGAGSYEYVAVDVITDLLEEMGGEQND